MPVYDVRCKECGEEQLDRYFRSRSSFLSATCSCGGALEQFGKPDLRLVGVTPSRPLVAGGYCIESNADAKKLEESGRQIKSAKTPEHKRMLDQMRTNLDTQARKNGHASWEAHIKDAKKYKAAEDAKKKEAPPG